jgi:DNA-binding response OmpR family regulator
MTRELPVLVLETDEPLQGLLEALLRRDGYGPAFVQDGNAALRLLARREFTAFIVDVSIAPSTLEDGARRGIGFIHYLQHNNPGLLSRTIVLTGLPDRDLPADFPAEVRLLRKPFDIDALRAAMSESSAAQHVSG